jgi:hypothetical protein
VILVIAPPPINDVANLPLNKRCRIYACCTCFAEQLQRICVALPPGGGHRGHPGCDAPVAAVRVVLWISGSSLTSSVNAAWRS